MQDTRSNGTRNMCAVIIRASWIKNLKITSIKLHNASRRVNTYIHHAIVTRYAFTRPLYSCLIIAHAFIPLVVNYVRHVTSQHMMSHSHRAVGSSDTGTHEARVGWAEVRLDQISCDDQKTHKKAKRLEMSVTPPPRPVCVIIGPRNIYKLPALQDTVNL